jgi:hypothetical protein
LLAEQKDKKALIAIDRKNKDLIIELWKQLHPVREALKEIKAIKKRYPQFKRDAEEILIKAIERHDMIGFKKACTNLAEYYRYAEEDSERALKCFYLYLFESHEEILANDFCKITMDWLGKLNLDALLKKYAKYQLSAKIERIDDDRYLRDFFEVYIKEDASKLRVTGSFDLQKETITKIKKRLNDIYYQEDKDIESEQIEIKFERLMENLEKDPDIKEELVKGEPVKKEPKKIEEFIKDSFFNNNRNNKREWMHGESIAYHMKRNIAGFIKNVVGRSKILVESNGEMQGTLSVLRRWNSFTPTLRSSINQSKGGGYFSVFTIIMNHLE